ncbi:MAG: YggS family pyridoxal phosphate-dependent enzyme [Hyphomicrobiales bacterium]
MESIKARLKMVKEAIANVASTSDESVLIAVSKTFDAEHILPTLEAGHRVFGENRVQESQGKWPALKEAYPDTELHLIGPLQSNKAADAVALFDVIHTVDREKIAKALSAEMKKQERRIPVFIQVNTGSEPQKAGVLPKEADAFIANCVQKIGLDVTGLMCIPPFDEDPIPHFTLLRELAKKHQLLHLSMGMSSDYEEAIKHGATHVRVGSAIFGGRG